MRILVTAGPTREPIDDVRYLSNASSGRMGHALATAARDARHEVTLVTGPVELPSPEGIEVVPVTTALEMRDAVLARYDAADAVLMAAAVADYRPATRIGGKRKKSAGPWDLRLVENPDILAELAARKTHQRLLGFALEAADGERNAREKLERKNLDWIVLNAPATIGAETSDFLILARDGTRTPHAATTKAALARALVALVTTPA